jgi:hypothetical protein
MYTGVSIALGYEFMRQSLQRLALVVLVTAKTEAAVFAIVSVQFEDIFEVALS